jgi:hypothetical protein
LAPLRLDPEGLNEFTQSNDYTLNKASSCVDITYILSTTPPDDTFFRHFLLHRLYKKRRL